MTAFILTKSHNAYDQFGEYFICWFETKPTIYELKRVLDNDVYCISGQSLEQLLEQGYYANEYIEYNLKEIKSQNAY